ncbi:glycosyltransferase family 4 protein [Candidatus Falkowbacteria bacterium]|nr:glycosyltransferase family 4 protein [Candidatus Falkowbacteria bacterium]NCT54925.1 glycosyltransferase family 4 protein [Candidatus Falkowbacteria bacterium]
MKILQVNKFHYPRGGADKYYLDLSLSLEKAGHEVANFSMHHPKNLKSPWSKYWLTRVSFNENLGFFAKLKIIGRVIYSLEAKRKFKKLVKDFKPDIIHLHNIYHHISPSILSVARRFKIPVVMHLHDYKLICPNHTLFVGGKNCDSCRGHKYFNCVKKRCLKNSFFASLLVALEMYIHHRVLKIYQKNIALFIAPSEHMKKTCLDFGWDKIAKDKFVVVYNSYSPELILTQGDLNADFQEDYLLYFGRLGAEKGIDTLLNALPATGETLKIVGSGEEDTKLKLKVESLKLRVEFLGYKSGEELRLLITKAKAIVMPSIWQENMPLSLLEAMSLGKTVIASRIGGFPEIIEDGLSGFLFEPGNFRDLASKINALKNYNLNLIGLKAKDRVKDLSPDNNLKEIIKVYSSL